MEEESTVKIFQPLTDLAKYIKIINTTERILCECPLFSKIGENETTSHIKFLRLYETFMLLSTVILFLSFLFYGKIILGQIFRSFQNRLVRF